MIGFAQRNFFGSNLQFSPEERRERGERGEALVGRKPLDFNSFIISHHRVHQVAFIRLQIQFRNCPYYQQPVQFRN